MRLTNMIDVFVDLSETITVTSTKAGTYVDGYWVAGVKNNTLVSAVVQPASSKDTTELLVQGDTGSCYKNFYAEHVFNTADKLSGVEADIVVYNGMSFKVLAVSAWEHIGNYQKITAVRI